MSNITDIIEILQDNVLDDKDRWIDTKIGWNYYKFKQDVDIYNTINNFINPIDHVKDRECYFTIVKNTDRIWAYRTEEALERFISLVNPEIKNQVSLGNSREAIDLVVMNGDKIHSLIELKPWEIGNSPIYAFVELVKNYCIISDYNVKELILLAPADYYKSYENKKGTIDQFFRLVDQFNSSCTAQFKLACLNIQDNEFNKIIKQIAFEDNNKWEKAKNTNKFLEKKLVRPTKDQVKHIEDILLRANWKYMTTPEDWFNL